MERQPLEELIRMILIAFVFALVIWIFIVFIFEDGNFRDAFFRTNNTNNEVVNSNTVVNTTPAPIPEQRNERTPVIRTDLKNAVIDIPVSPRMEFSGLSREEIYNLRINAVNTSPIFSQTDYQPNPAIYGGIVDNLPWISAYCALHFSECTNENMGKGDTRDSVGILNPELLFYVSLAEYGDTNFYKDYYFVPYKLTYNPETKTIAAYYQHEKRTNGTRQSIYLEDMNARDMGYNFAFMNYSNNVKFYKKYKDNTLKSDIKELQGFYTHGSACRIPGGCNNAGPYRVEHNSFYLNDLPASFNIKLWKNKPKSAEQEADINYQMIFE